VGELRKHYRALARILDSLCDVEVKSIGKKDTLSGQHNSKKKRAEPESNW
jgi:hypothetical protein